IHNETHGIRGGPSTFGALGELQSWRPPPNTKYFFPPRKRNCNFQTLFCPVRLHFFHIKTTTIATMNKHSFKNKSLRKCHGCAGLRSGHAPCSTVYGHTHTHLHLIFTRARIHCSLCILR